MYRTMTTTLQANVGVRAYSDSDDDADLSPGDYKLHLVCLSQNQEAEVTLTKAEVEQLIAWLAHPTLPLTIG